MADPVVSRGESIKIYFRSCSQKYSFQHLTVFTLTFFCYAFFHASRKVYPNTKSIIQEEWSPAHRVEGNGSNERSLGGFQNPVYACLCLPRKFCVCVSLRI